MKLMGCRSVPMVVALASAHCDRVSEDVLLSQDRITSASFPSNVVAASRGVDRRAGAVSIPEPMGANPDGGETARSIAGRYALPPGCGPRAATFSCNPVTNEGCVTRKGEACDDDEDGGYRCYPAPNEVKEGGECNDRDGPSCEARLACDNGRNGGPNGICRRLCCSAEECGSEKLCEAIDPEFGSLGFCR